MSKSIITLLKEQHQEIRKTLDALAATTERGLKIRSELLAELDRALTHHMTVEEEIFYPSFKHAVDRKKDKRIFFEAKEEHQTATKVLRSLIHADAASPAFGAKVKVLKELVEHHLTEEEKEMMPVARDVMSQQELIELGEKLLHRQEQLDSGRAWDRTDVSEFSARLS